MKRNFVKLLVPVCALLFLGGCFQGDKVEKLEAEVADLREQVEDLESDLSKLERQMKEVHPSWSFRDRHRRLFEAKDERLDTVDTNL